MSKFSNLESILASSYARYHPPRSPTAPINATAAPIGPTVRPAAPDLTVDAAAAAEEEEEAAPDDEEAAALEDEGAGAALEATALETTRVAVFFTHSDQF